MFEEAAFADSWHNSRLISAIFSLQNCDVEMISLILCSSQENMFVFLMNTIHEVETLRIVT